MLVECRSRRLSSLTRCRTFDTRRYLCDPLRKCLKDEDPYVRKTAAVCVAKLHDIDPALVEDQGFIDALQELLSDANPMVVRGFPFPAVSLPIPVPPSSYATIYAPFPHTHVARLGFHVQTVRGYPGIGLMCAAMTYPCCLYRRLPMPWLRYQRSMSTRPRIQSSTSRQAPSRNCSQPSTSTCPPSLPPVPLILLSFLTLCRCFPSSRSHSPLFVRLAPTAFLTPCDAFLHSLCVCPSSGAPSGVRSSSWTLSPFTSRPTIASASPSASA